MLPRLVLVTAAFAGFLCPGLLGAQDEGPLRSRLIAESGQLQVEIRSLFDSAVRSALDEGFPARLQLRVTLWRDGFFDDRVGEFDWRASARREGTEGSYRLDVVPGDESRSVADFESLQEALSRELDVPLRPIDPGRYYYHLTLRVESLSASDLDEMERWLRGASEEEPDEDDRGALSRGVQRLFVRALGLPSRRLQRRTRAFDWRGEG